MNIWPAIPGWLEVSFSAFDLLLKVSLQAGLIVLIVLAVRALFAGRLPGRWLHALWLIVFLRLALPWAVPLAWSPFGLLASVSPSAIAPDELPAPEPDPHTSAFVGGIGTPSDQHSLALVGATNYDSKSLALAPLGQTPLRQTLLGYIYMVWLTGILILGSTVLLTSLRFRRVLSAKRPVTSQPVLDLLEDCRQAMHVRTPVSVVVTDNIPGPALYGFLRPRLLLPPGLLETLSRDELEHVFLHELAHLRRHDVLLGWLTCILQILHWCNPLVWMAGSRMRADRELACDALVLSVLRRPDPRAYGQTIVRLLERFSSPRYLPALTGILEEKGQLQRRIVMIARFEPQANRFSLAGLVLFLLIGGIALTDAPGQAAVGAKAEATDSDARSTVPTESFSRHKIYTITPGKGLDILSIDDSVEQVRKVFGEPTGKREFNRSYEFSYDSAGVDVLFSKESDRVNEIHFNEEFRGKLPQGFRMGSPLERLAAKTGGIKKTVNASPEEAQNLRMGSDRVLYNQKRGREITAYELTDSNNGVNYWFDADKKLVQVVVYAGKADKAQTDEPGAQQSLRKAGPNPLQELPEGSRIDEHGNIVDLIDLPFVNDPAVLGKWESVDFVKEIKDFTPGKQSFKRKLFLKGMIFEEEGKANYGFSQWTKGKVIHRPNKTASAYVVKEVEGQPYLFYEWKSGDYIRGHQKPWSFVLKKLPTDSAKLSNPRELFDMDQEFPEAQLGSDSHVDEDGRIVDKIDYPFVDDPDVIGTWKSVDFVKRKEQFDPAKPSWKGDLFLKELAFEPDGKMGPGWSGRWTKGKVLNAGSKTAPAYEIVAKDGEKYMFFEWKSGDYTILHRRPAYYVLKKVEQ